MDHIPISSILIDDRVRKDMGDIPALAASIAEVGMLQPLLLGDSRRLIAGYRRLLAAKHLGWEQVPVFIVGNFKDALHRLKAERDENTCRKAFTPSELGTVAAQLLAMEKAAAKERQQATQKAGNAKLPVNPGARTVRAPETGRAADKVGEALGVSGPTAQKAAAVVEAAKADPETFGDLPAQMDANGVKPAHAEMKKRDKRCENCIRKFPPGKSMKDCEGCKAARKGRQPGDEEPAKRSVPSGKVIFDNRKVTEMIGKLTRLFSDRAEKLNLQKSPGWTEVRGRMNDLITSWESWLKQSS